MPQNETRHNESPKVSLTMAGVRRLGDFMNEEISKASEARGWTSVEDNFPQHGQRVIVAVYDKFRNPYVTVARYHESQNMWLEDVDYFRPIIDTVLHWQLFPEPPKG